ncbi:MAG TPA: FKBP-type peptidyl-prolyl cis-trans isomerase [Sphingobium sp.]|uniref:FKBP-type peptidyl-prolyl cis-trans isomerase n=1 Tax=Sphingobium sp. TaxID=1912891 RepID=UPI002ED45970
MVLISAIMLTLASAPLGMESAPIVAAPIPQTEALAQAGEVVMPGIRYRVISTGTTDARRPTRNSAVRVRYEGRLDDGTVFDRSPEEGRIFPVRAMIAGYQAALLKMQQGDEWDITIPAELAYGSQGPAPMGGKTLHFRVKLLDVGELPPAPPPFLSEMPR